MDSNRIFRFNVDVCMTENGLKPEVALYDSAVDLGAKEGEGFAGLRGGVAWEKCDVGIGPSGPFLLFFGFSKSLRTDILRRV